METFDVINENDEVIGRATSKECHTNKQLIHRVVHFTLVNLTNKHILLTKRAEGLLHDPGMWCFPGEHVKAGESYSKAAIRGITEELGFVPKTIVEVAHHIFYQPTQTEYVRFFIAFWNNSNLTLQETEIQDMQWLDTGILQKQKNEYSAMTKHWIKTIEWKRVM